MAKVTLGLGTSGAGFAGVKATFSPPIDVELTTRLDEVLRQIVDSIGDGAQLCDAVCEASPTSLARVEVNGYQLVLTLVPPTQLSKLTRCEREIAALVGRCWSNKRIAQQLGKSEKTVANELTRIYSKLGIQSRTELARVAVFLPEVGRS